MAVATETGVGSARGPAGAALATQIRPDTAAMRVSGLNMSNGCRGGPEPSVQAILFFKVLSHSSRHGEKQRMESMHSGMWCFAARRDLDFLMLVKSMKGSEKSLAASNEI